MKRIISLLLSLIMTLSIMTIGMTTVFAADETLKVGDTIQYGTFPQTQVRDADLIKSLNSVSKAWRNPKYGDEMKYCDFTYKNVRYRAVHYKDYNDEYNLYFIFEPIEWIVLDPAKGFVLAKNILDIQTFQKNRISYGVDLYGITAYYTSKDYKYYSNNYAQSGIRNYLADDFYNTAFNDAQKSNIKTTTLDNSAYSADYSDFNAESTKDKVFLLSYSEVLNTNYGFSNSEYSDGARKASSTNYAGDTSSWWLRSANSNSYRACRVYYDGHVDSYSVDYYSGVRPALCLSNLKSDTSGNNNTTGIKDGAATPDPNKKDDKPTNPDKDNNSGSSNNNFFASFFVSIRNFFASIANIFKNIFR